MNKDTQLTHTEHEHSGKKFPLSVLANDLSSPLNVGSLFRLCDALGVSKLYLCGDTPIPPSTKINKTSRSTEKYVEYEYQKNAEELVSSLKDEAVFIVSLEITSDGVMLDSKSFKEAMQTQKNICLILGAENTGVSEALLSLSDLNVYIPMYGNNSSMNVVSAASIACYEIISLIQD